MGETTGFIKIIEDANNQKLLGAHMIGPEVSELLPELTLAWQHGLNAADIGRNVHTHPTLSEVIMEAAHDVEGHAIHK
jgi:dihydrolipoamide dehydrogenase